MMLARCASTVFSCKPNCAPISLFVRPSATSWRTSVSQFERIAKSRHIQLQPPIDSGPLLLVDADLVSRMLENILNNALRYTPAGGRIAATISPTEIRIANTGPAIPVELRGRIFEKYGQADKRVGRTSLGLGLYFCAMIAAAHGGHLSVTETTEFPTVFILSLPPNGGGGSISKPP